MRSWHPIPPVCLDRKRLLGEHNEVHCMWTVITQCKRGYMRHPETQRWIGHLAALARRHDILVREMQARGYNHRSPLPEVERFGSGPVRWPPLIEPIEVMRRKLAAKIL